MDECKHEFIIEREDGMYVKDGKLVNIVIIFKDINIFIYI